MARRRRNPRNRSLRTRRTKDRNHRREGAARPFPAVVYQPQEPQPRPVRLQVTVDGEALTPERIAELRRQGWKRRLPDYAWAPPAGDPDAV